MKTTCIDLIIQNVKYLSNHWSDLSQILNLNLRDQPKVNKGLKWRQPALEDDLKIQNVKYLSNHWLDLTQVLNLNYVDQTKVYKGLKWIQPASEDDLK